MLDPRRMIAFQAVVEAGSFSAAAEQLHRTQPSVSRAVADLEASIGMTLLHRRRDGLVLTEAGTRLLRRAETVSGQLRRADDEMQALRRGETGRVRLGAFPTATRTLAVATVRALRTTHPGVEVTLEQVHGGSGARLVATGALDVAVGFELSPEPPRLPPELRSVALMSEPLLLATPHDHPLAGRQGLRLGDLAEERWIQGAGPDSPRLVERAFRRLGLPVDIAAESNANQSLVAAGVGVTLIPALALRHLPDDLAVMPLDDPPSRDVHAVVLTGPPVPAIEAVLDALTAAAGEARHGW